MGDAGSEIFLHIHYIHTNIIITPSRTSVSHLSVYSVLLARYCSSTETLEVGCLAQGFIDDKILKNTSNKSNLFIYGLFSAH